MRKRSLHVGLNDPRLPPGFWARVEVQENGCWQWTGTPAKVGYGRFTFEGCRQYVHRLAYIRLVGPIPEGLDVDHRCHAEDPLCVGLCPHRLCVNPDHLEPATRSENVRRGHKWAAPRTHCKRGHPYGDNDENRYPNDSGCRLCRKER